jgi:hypothetical protein
MKAEVSTSTSGLATTDDLIAVLSRSRVTGLHQALVSHPGAEVVGQDHRSQGARQQLCQRDPDSLRFSLPGGVLFLVRTDLCTDHDDDTLRSVVTLARSGPNELWAATACFASAHAPWIGWQALWLLLPGLALGGLWWRYRRLSLNVLVHAGFNAALVLATVWF